MMLNNELNDYSKQDPFDEKDELIFSESNLEGYSDFYKDSEESKVWWIDKIGVIGEFLFSFDKKKIYNLFLDYPHNMTEEEVKIFDSENPFWRDFFFDNRIWTILEKTVKNSHYKKNFGTLLMIPMFFSRLYEIFLRFDDK